MARLSLSVVQALRTTARRLEAAAGLKAYQWGHMGSCNCGHLAQTVCRLDPAAIHQRALLTRHGDWDDQLNDYCPHSGLPLDEVIDQMLDAGFSRADLAHLERLSDPVVRAVLGPARANALRHNERADVVLYLRTWADQLEAALLDTVPAVPAAVPAPVPASTLVSVLV
ncbi:MAG: hypothetical protein H7330_01195 [Hymenobacteraceae bacterium]|nr:hypothetical protein [Hymenobacteraceae bacterium]